MNYIERWTINESLLQSYRSIFISSHSFLLTAGAVLSGKSHLLLYTIAMVAIGIIWIVWFPVVRARLLVVDYYKYGATLNSQDEKLLCSEHEYVHSDKKRNAANTLFGLKSNWRTTRVKMDIVLPVLFTALWVALMAHEHTAA